ncbi:unnamed protein product [Schistosoma mattheei]|uniref:Uncharacterized protein n=1 Tax=Schistosoma mattheei TaxID=31246 RepID=A0A183NXA3_9TREM|nr:unnamed protein product [Schistosoma mattheei]
MDLTQLYNLFRSVQILLQQAFLTYVKINFDLNCTTLFRIFINDKTNNEVMNVTGLHRGLEEKFDLFCSATTFESILACFYELCDGAVSKPTKQSWNIFHELSVNLKSYWKAAALFSKLEKRVKMKQYHHQTLCRDVNVLVIGCGPCGMRCAIELALLGARVIIIEKRHTFSR